MNMLEAILGAQGGDAAQQLGRQFGLDQSQVSSALSALVPAVAAVWYYFSVYGPLARRAN